MSQCLERNKKKKNITMNKQKNQISDLTWYAVPILVIVIPILLKPGFVFLLEVFNENVPYKPKFLQSIKHLYLVISKWGLEHYGLP